MHMDYNYSDEEFEEDSEDEIEAAASTRFSRDTRVLGMDMDYNYSDEEFEEDSEDEIEASTRFSKNTREFLMEKHTPFQADAIPRRSCIKPRACTRPAKRNRNKLAFGGTEVKLYYASDEERQFKLVMGKKEEYTEDRAVKVSGYSTSKVQMDELDDLDLFVSRRLKYKKAEVDDKRNCLKKDTEYGDENELGLKTNQLDDKYIPRMAASLESQVEREQGRIGVESCVDQITGINQLGVNRDLITPGGGGMDSPSDTNRLKDSVGLENEPQHQSLNEPLERFGEDKGVCERSLSDVEIPNLKHKPEFGLTKDEYELPTSWDAASRAREWQKTAPRGRDTVRVGLLNTSSVPNLGERPQHDYMPTQSLSADMSRDWSDPYRLHYERNGGRYECKGVGPKRPEIGNPQQSVPSGDVGMFLESASSSERCFEEDKMRDQKLESDVRRPNGMRHTENQIVDIMGNGLIEKRSTRKQISMDETIGIGMHTPHESATAACECRRDYIRSRSSSTAPSTASSAYLTTYISGRDVSRPHSRQGRGRVDEGQRPNTFSGCRTPLRQNPRRRNRSMNSKTYEMNFFKTDPTTLSNTSALTSACPDVENARSAPRSCPASPGFSESQTTTAQWQCPTATPSSEVQCTHAPNQSGASAFSRKRRRLGEVIVSVRQRLRKFADRLFLLNCFS